LTAALFPAADRTHAHVPTHTQADAVRKAP
jgi:hypothetical protein